MIREGGVRATKEEKKKDGAGNEKDGRDENLGSGR